MVVEYLSSRHKALFRRLGFDRVLAVWLLGVFHSQTGVLSNQMPPWMPLENVQKAPSWNDYISAVSHLTLKTLSAIILMRRRSLMWLLTIFLKSCRH